MDHISSTLIAQRNRRLWQFIKCFLKFLLGLLCAFVILLMAGMGGLLWRLTQGPLDITAFSHYLAPVTLYKNPHHKTETVTLHWGRLLVHWNPARPSEPSALKVEAHDLKTISGDGRILDNLSDFRIALDLSSLWHGSVKLIRAYAENGSIRLVRKGSSYRALGGYVPLQKQKSPSSGFLKFDLSSFQILKIDHLKVTLQKEEALQDYLALTLSKLDAHYQGSTGWYGNSEASLEQNMAGEASPDHHVNVFVSVQPDGKGKTKWQARSSLFNPSDYKSWVSGGADLLSKIDLPLSLEGSGHVLRQNMSGEWKDFTLHLLTEAGCYKQNGAPPLKVKSADFTFYGQNIAKGHNVVEIKKGALFLKDSGGQEVPFSFTGHMDADGLFLPENIKIFFALNVPKLDFAHLSSIWPIAIAKGGRRWMAENMTSGTAENFTLKVTLASQTGWDDLNDTNLEGDVWGHDLTVHWLKPLPPVEHIEAQGHFLSADKLQIDLKNGLMKVQGESGIHVPKGKIVLTGLSKPDQKGDINLDLNGAVKSFLSILVQRRLHLLARYSLPLKHVRGKMEGKLGVNLPLDANVKMSEIGFDSHAGFEQVGFETKMLGSVKEGHGSFHVTSDEITADVKAKIRDVPLSFSFWDSFKQKPQGVINRSLRAQINLDAAGLKSFGIPVTAKRMDGAVIAKAGYAQKEIVEKKQQGDLTLTVDMTPAAFDAVFWKKKKGAPAHLMAHALWLNGDLQTIDELDGNGPDLAVRGMGLVTNGEVTGLRINPLHIGRNQGALTVRWPGSHSRKSDYNVFFNGDTLDISPLLALKVTNKKETDRKKPEGPLLTPFMLPQGNWAIAFKACELYYSEQKAFMTVLAGAHWSGQSLQEAHLMLARPYPFNLVLQDSARHKGGKSFLLSSQNLGGMLASFNVMKKLENGHFLMKGYFAPRGKTSVLGLGLGPFYGQAKLEDIALLNPPIFLKLANLLTPSEWQQLGSNRLGGIKASVDFSLDNQNFIFQKGQLGNAVLGGRFRGRINMLNSDFRMQGTVSPFFSYKDPSKKSLPIMRSKKLKKTFSLMGMTYKIDGTIDDPHVKVSPFSSFSSAP